MSVVYTTLTRLGYDSKEYLDKADFSVVLDFNTPYTITQLGTATADMTDMSLELLRRCRVVVVCTNDITENMEKEILLAKKLGITATTLAGIRRIAAHTKKGEDA